MLALGPACGAVRCVAGGGLAKSCSSFTLALGRVPTSCGAGAAVPPVLGCSSDL